MWFLHTYVPSPVAVSIGTWPVHWYGVVLALAVLVGYAVSGYLWRRNVKRPLEFDSLVWWMVLCGFIGARVLDVFVFEWWYFQNHLNEIWYVWQGGLSFHGGLLGGAVAFLWWCRSTKHSWREVGDVLAPGLALGQAAGRWGNYFNQELFGTPTTLPWGIPITVANRPGVYLNATYFHPTFLYESVGLVLLAWLLWRLYRKHQHAGQVLAVYLSATGALRLVLEFIRVDEQDYWFGLRSGFVLALLTVASGVLVWWWSLQADKKRINPDITITPPTRDGV